MGNTTLPHPNISESVVFSRPATLTAGVPDLHSSSCSFCRPAACTTIAPWDVPLFETAHFFVVPSLGALIEGWLLIVPRIHVISLGAMLPQWEEEFWDVVRIVRAIITHEYGEVSLFEHGPSAPRHAAGCGVDHAHMHVVPFYKDLEEAAAPYIPPAAMWSDSSRLRECRLAYRSGDDYLYYEGPAKRQRILSGRDIGSQVFRRVIAAELGVPAEYNWRKHPQVAIVMATLDKLRNRFYSDGF